MKIAIGTDHAGYELKEFLKRELTALGHKVEDFGAFNEEASDYPDFVIPAAQSVVLGANEVAIVLGGSGNGEAIAANKVPGIRCGLVWSEEIARLTRHHNNANAIALGARFVQPAEALEYVQIFLDSDFDGGRHADRLAKLPDSGDSIDVAKS